MRTTHIIYAAALALAVAGCRQDAPQTETIDPQGLRYEVAVAQPAGNGETGTRAVKTGWTEGDAIVVHFDGNEQNTLWLRYNAAGEWETTSASVATINPAGSAQALHSTFLSPGAEAGAIDADGAQVFTDTGSYIVVAGTVYVSLTLDQRITSRITVEGLENPGGWVLAGPGLGVWSGITPGLFGTTGGTWDSTLRGAFVASDIDGDIYAHGHAVPWEAADTASFIVLGYGATEEGTTLRFKNLATGKIYERTYASANLGSGKAVTIQMPEGTTFPGWTDLTPETITADPDPLDFGSLHERYIAREPKEVVIRNTGKSVVTLVQPTATDFEIGPLSQTTIASGESATLPVSLKTGLAPGEYSETIDITGNGTAAASVQVLFTVKAIPDNGIGYEPPQENNW